MIRLLLFALVLSPAARSQEPESRIIGDIDSARTALFDVARSFYDGSLPDDRCVQQLGDALRRVSSAPDSMMPWSIRGHPGWHNHKQNLALALFRFDLLRSQSTARDSLHDAFRELFYAFHHLGRPLFHQKVVADGRQAVLLFAASITCECTRRMCDEYVAELARLRGKHTNGIELIIIDSVVNAELLKEYEVETIPSILLLDMPNKELGRMDGGDHVRQRMRKLLGKIKEEPR